MAVPGRGFALLAVCMAVTLTCVDLRVATWAVGEVLAAMLPFRVHALNTYTARLSHDLAVSQNWSTGSNGVAQTIPIPTHTWGEEFQVDMARPCLIRGAREALPAWDTAWLKERFGDIHVDFFSDARVPAVEGGSIPDVKAPLREVVEQVEAGLPAKTGTEMLFRNQPDTLRELPLEALHRLFGNGHFEPSAMGIGLTVPIFLSQGREESKFEGSTSVNATRTDFHCEPIANIAMQFVGRKRWTLVDPALSFGLRPSLSPDGRAYIYANVPPDGDLIGRVDKYEVTTEPGDILYVPTWWWHRIDYLPGETSFTVSLFHLRPTQMIGNNALFITVLLPNLVKELVGWKTQ